MIRISRLRGLGLLAYALALAVLGGCLPDEAETLGNPPGGPVVARYDFQSGGIPGAFFVTGSGGNWAIDPANGGIVSGAPGLTSGTVSHGGAGSYCIAVFPGLGLSRVDYQYRFTTSGHTFNFYVDATAFDTQSVSVGWTGAAIPIDGGSYTYSWCVDAPGPAGPSTLIIDDIVLRP